jgi:hypothetical protein
VYQFCHAFNWLSIVYKCTDASPKHSTLYVGSKKDKKICANHEYLQPLIILIHTRTYSYILSNNTMYFESGWITPASSIGPLKGNLSSSKVLKKTRVYIMSSGLVLQVLFLGNLPSSSPFVAEHMWRKAGDGHTSSPPREHRVYPLQCRTDREGPQVWYPAQHISVRTHTYHDIQRISGYIL